MRDINHWWKWGVGIAATGILLMAGCSSTTAHIADVAVCVATFVVGAVLALVLFLADDDMRGLKTLLVGAISGTSLAKSEAIITRISVRFGDLASPSADQRYLARVFFLAIAAGLLGFFGCFLVIRVGGLGRAVAREQQKLKDMLKDVPEVPLVPLPELDEFWPRLNAPSDDVVEKLAKTTDWSTASPADAVRAGAVFFAKERWDDVIRALEPQLRNAEPPGPMAFDLYAGALVRRNASGTFSAEAARKVDQLCSRMLTYWPDSFLVNLDVGFLNLYLDGRAEFARHYAERALRVRPDSGAANLNLACALAQEAGDASVADDETDAKVAEIIAVLERFFRITSDAADRLNREGDFDALKSKSAKFAAWLAEKGVK